MENNITNTPLEKLPKGDQKITTPVAIVVAGVLIAVAVLLTRGGGTGGSDKVKPFSEQVGVNKTTLDACVKGTDLNSLYSKSASEADTVMKSIPADQRGTPYIVLVGKDGTKIELRGNIPYDDYPVQGSTEKAKGVKTIIDSMIAGKATSDYTGELPPPSKDDHIIGSLDAPVIIVEYSDLECPYCKEFSSTAKKLVAESNGNVAWIYRNWIVHPGALPKAGAAECIAKLKGNDTYWKYIDLLFSLVKTQKDISDEAMSKL